jgi:hypothetical protein
VIGVWDIAEPALQRLLALVLQLAVEMDPELAGTVDQIKVVESVDIGLRNLARTLRGDNPDQRAMRQQIEIGGFETR